VAAIGSSEAIMQLHRAFMFALARHGIASDFIQAEICLSVFIPSYPCLSVLHFPFSLTGPLASLAILGGALRRPFVARRMMNLQEGNSLENGAFRYSKEGSISFLKKRNKKLLFVGLRVGHDQCAPKRVKVFWFFFSKKNCFLPTPPKPRAKP
jgi:hypothetical protein